MEHISTDPPGSTSAEFTRQTPNSVHNPARINSFSSLDEATKPQPNIAIRTPASSVDPLPALPPMNLPSFARALIGDRTIEPPMSIWGLADLKLKSYNQNFVQLLGFDGTALAKGDFQIGDLFALRGAPSELVDSSRDRILQAHGTLARTDDAKRIETLIVSIITPTSEFKTLHLTLVPLAGHERVLWITEEVTVRAPSPALFHSRSPSPSNVNTQTAPVRPVEYHFDSPPWKPKEVVKKREKKEKPWDQQIMKFSIEHPPTADKPTADKPPLN